MTHDPNTEASEYEIHEVTLGEIWRSQRRLEVEIKGLNTRLDRLFAANIPSRIETLERRWEWLTRIVVGTVVVGLMGLLFASGGIT